MQQLPTQFFYLELSLVPVLSLSYCGLDDENNDGVNNEDEEDIDDDAYDCGDGGAAWDREIICAIGSAYLPKAHTTHMSRHKNAKYDGATLIES